MHHCREYRSRRALRGEGSGRRIAGGDDSGNLERDLRRCGSSVAGGAVHAGARAGSAAREEGNEENRNDRVGRPDCSREVSRTWGFAVVPRQRPDAASARSSTTGDECRVNRGRWRVSLPSFQLLRPKTLDAAMALMAKYEGQVKVVAGVTDLLPSMKQKLFTPPYVLDLRGVGELRGIHSRAGEGVEIGALTSLSAIEHSLFIRKDY